MASTSSRMLRLLSLQTRLDWPGEELARELEVSPPELTGWVRDWGARFSRAVEY